MYRVAKSALTAGDPGNSRSKICAVQPEVSGIVARLWKFKSWTNGHSFAQSACGIYSPRPLQKSVSQVPYLNRVFNIRDAHLGNVLCDNRACNSCYNGHR